MADTQGDRPTQEMDAATAIVVGSITSDGVVWAVAKALGDSDPASPVSLAGVVCQVVAEAVGQEMAKRKNECHS